MLRFFVILLLVCLSGCDFVTDTDWNVVEVVERDSSMNVWVSSSFYGTANETRVIPLILKKRIIRSPYKYHVSIHGDFDEVEVKNMVFEIGDRKVAIRAVPIKREESQHFGAAFSVGQGSIELEADSNLKLKLVVHFIGIKNGKGQELTRTVTFQMQKIKHIGNEFIDKLMSV